MIQTFDHANITIAATRPVDPHSLSMYMQTSTCIYIYICVFTYNITYRSFLRHYLKGLAVAQHVYVGIAMPFGSQARLRDTSAISRGLAFFHDAIANERRSVAVAAGLVGPAWARLTLCGTWLVIVVGAVALAGLARLFQYCPYLGTC